MSCNCIFSSTKIVVIMLFFFNLRIFSSQTIKDKNEPRTHCHQQYSDHSSRKHKHKICGSENLFNDQRLVEESYIERTC